MYVTLDATCLCPEWRFQAGCSRSPEKLGQPLSTRSGHHQPVEVVRGGVKLCARHWSLLLQQRASAAKFKQLQGGAM